MSGASKSRRWREDNLLRACQARGAPIIWLDMEITRRMRRHLIYGPDGLLIGQFETTRAIFEWLAESETHVCAWLADDWPKPIWTVLSPAPPEIRPLKRRSRGD